MESADFEEKKVDNELELKRLARSIDLSEKYFLYFVACNSLPRQKSFIEQLKKEHPELKIEVIFFESPIKSLLHELRQRLQGKNLDAVFVSGLRYSIPPAESSDTSNFLAHLNVTRDSFPQILTCPLYLWLPEYALSQVFNNSPDFFSVRSSIFFFDTDEETLKQQTSQAISIGGNQSSALLLAEREQRIENLQELLDEFQSLPTEKRDFQTEYDLKDRLANMFWITARHSEAETLRKELIAFIKDKNQQKYAEQLNNLALVYYAQGKYDEAIKLYQEALEIAKKTIGTEHSEYATRLHNLAYVYYIQGKYQETIKLYQEVLEIDKKTIGTEHPDYAKCLNNFASVYQAQGKYDKAIKLYQEALEIDKKTVGTEHPSYATHLNNLANIYTEQGKYDEAITLYQEALEIDKKTIGTEHPEYAKHLNNLAYVYKAQGKYQDALPLYQEALQIRQAKLPESHPDIQRSKNNLQRCKEMLEKER
jgi:tetratricopeptide (TPR) repeat protein